MSRKKPSAPKISRSRQLAAVERKLARLAGERTALIDRGAPNRDIIRMDDRIKDARYDRGVLLDERRRAQAAGKRGRRAARDKFAELVSRSPRLTEWHMRVADALVDTEAGALSAGRSGVAVSGRAGDGLGRLVLVGPDGELDERALGALAVAGVSARSVLQRWHRAARVRDRAGRKIEAPRTFDPKGVKAARKVSDGGLAAITDARRRSETLWEVYFSSAADVVGGPSGYGMVVAYASEQVIRGADSASGVVRKLLRVKKSRGLRELETAMMAGLEAVAPRLGFEGRADRALDSGTV